MSHLRVSRGLPLGDVQTWLNLQTAYDPKVADKTVAAKIAKDVAPMAA